MTERLEERRWATIGGTRPPGGIIPGVPRGQQRYYVGVLAVGIPITFTGNVFVAVGVTALGLAIVWALLFEGKNGSAADKFRREFRWRWRKAQGYTTYEPWDGEAWLDHISGTRPLTKERARRMRYHPDAADGLAWLQAERGLPGITWQRPAACDETFTVTFEVDGLMNGLESAHQMDAGQEAFGRYLNSFGASLALHRQVQISTRVMPPDLAWHDKWVRDNIDPAFAGSAIEQSYAQVLEACEAGALVMRHYVTVTWPRSSELELQADGFGGGLDGIRRVLAMEIHAQERALHAAGLGVVRPLSARRTVALMRHMQDPDLAPAAARDVDPERIGLESRDTRGAHIVKGSHSEWYHATAMAQGWHLSRRRRLALWLLPWQTGMRQAIIRTMAFHLRVIDSTEARGRAEKDAVAVRTQIHQLEAKGKMVDPNLFEQLSEAEQHLVELGAGGQGQGFEWVAYVTVSARSIEELRIAKRIVTEEADRGIGWSKLTWLDTMQSASAGATWPLGRGLAPAAAGARSRAQRAIGRSSAEKRDE